MNRLFIKIIFVGLTSSLLLVSCKTKSIVVDSAIKENNSTINNTIENYYNNKVAFSTLYIKSNVRFDNGKQTQNVTAEIKIKKDEQILVSIRFLGITMAKALITPKSVSYYEKINGSFFEGDFSFLSQWLGTDLNFDKVQNMLLGRAIDDLKIGKYNESKVDQTIQLEDILDIKNKKFFYLDDKTYLLKKQEITQIAESRKIEVVYSNHKSFNEANLPFTILINSFQTKGKAEINLEFNAVTFNEELSFPYSVPNDYKRILIK